MAVEKRFTELPATGSATMSDIICAVQGYTSPANLGLSVQETLQQVYNLFQSNIILSYPGNPNGFVAGTTYQFCWDTVGQGLYICTTSGTAATAAWTLITGGGGTISTWTAVTTTPFAIIPNGKYVPSNGAVLTNFTLPAIAPFGTAFELCGFSAGGWRINLNAGQSITFGNVTTTVGTGSLASTDPNDCVSIVCTNANTNWNVINSVGMLNVL